MKREDNEARKKATELARHSKRSNDNILASHGKDLSNSTFLQALTAREEANRREKLTVILF